MTPSGSELVTYRLVPQCLNQLRHQQRAHNSNRILQDLTLNLAPEITALQVCAA